MNINSLVFELLYGPTQRVHDVARITTTLGNWGEVIRLVEAWKVLPRLNRVLRDHMIELDSTSSEWLGTKLARYAVQSGYIARRAGEVTQLLEIRGVEVLAFKGVATLARLHHSPAERMLADIDLIVREEDLEPALEAIQESRFSPSIPGSLQDQRRFSENRIHKDNYTIQLQDAEGLEIDLHYGLHGHMEALLDQGLWSRARFLPLLGRPIRCVAPLDAILLIAHHALRNHFLPFPTVRDLGDLADYWRVCAKDWAISELAAKAEYFGLGSTLLGLLGILEQSGALSLDDEDLIELRNTLGNQDVAESRYLREWFYGRLETPNLSGNKGGVDFFILLNNPLSLLRLFHNRLKEKRQSEQLSWRRNLKGVREQLHGSDLRRAGNIVNALARMNLQQWRCLFGVLSAQRRAFGLKHIGYRFDR